MDDLSEGQIVVCVRFSGSQPLDLINDESSHQAVRVLAVEEDHVLVESRWLPGSCETIDALEYGLAHNESRSWSTSYCVLSEESFRELRNIQRANYTHPLNRGSMRVRQLIPLG